VRVAGVDGCPGGWVAVVLDGTRLSWSLCATADLAALAAVVGIDIPIGLPDGPERRLADRAARQRLPGATSRVFPTPVRAVLAATSYAEACALSRAATGRAVSRQTWNITTKIAEVDLAVRSGAPLVEVHPEVSYAAMTGRVLPSKKTPAGRSARHAALAGWLGAPVGLPTLRPARVDDLLDALACAWTAERWSRGDAEVLGGADLDGYGTPQRIIV